MDALILAAGHGKRLRPLTLTTPKPLISVGRYRLIEIHLLRLKKHGFEHIVINLAYLGEQIRQFLGNGDRYGVSISYSFEPDGPLETAGGIVQALDLIQSQRFVVVNGDILTDYPFQQLCQPNSRDNSQVAHGELVLVDNPPHHPAGDFILDDGQITASVKANGLAIKTPLAHKTMGLTYAGIACFDKALFSKLRPGVRPLAPILHQAVKDKQLAGQHHTGFWHDIGTLERLEAVRTEPAIQRWIDSL